MKKWLAPIFGFFPFIYGYLMTFCINILPENSTFLIMPILSALFLVMWCQLAKIANFHLCDQRLTMLFMHIIGLLVFSLLCIDALLPFLSPWIVNLLLFYIMPTMPVGMMVGLLAGSDIIVYMLCLLFMVVSAYLGCNSKRRKVK